MTPHLLALRQSSARRAIDDGAHFRGDDAHFARCNRGEYRRVSAGSCIGVRTPRRCEHCDARVESIETASLPERDQSARPAKCEKCNMKSRGSMWPSTAIRPTLLYDVHNKIVVSFSVQNNQMKQIGFQRRINRLR